jgi:hypothetical protein
MAITDNTMKGLEDNTSSDSLLSKEQDALYADYCKQKELHLSSEPREIPLWLLELYDSFRFYYPCGDRRKSPPELEEEGDLPF